MLGKIKKIVSEKAWNDSFFVKVEMDNGDSGDIYSKSAGAYKEGQEIDYDVDKSKGDGKHAIKIKQSGSFGGAKKPWVGEDPDVKLAGMSMSYAKDLVIAGKIDMKAIADTAELIAIRIKSIAEKLKASKKPE